jgi:effector-binding domain-containing protein
LPTIHPKLEHREEQPYVAIPIQATLKQWGSVNALVPEVVGWLEQHGIAPAGAPFYRYRVIGGADTPFDLEVGVPVPIAVAGDNRVMADAIPAGVYAVHVHTGHPDRLIDVFPEIESWAKARGIEWDKRIEGDDEVWAGRFETFLTNPDGEPDLEKWSIENAWLVRGSDTARS